MSDLANPSTLLTLTLASLKAAGVIDLPWFVVFTPALIYLVLSVFAFLLLTCLVNTKPFPFI
jgi:hypothetical protein